MYTSNKSLIIDALCDTAAFAVLLLHGDHANLIKINWLSPIKDQIGFFGVDLFFIISGYLIWISARKTLPNPRGHIVYAVHRATRLMPLYYVNMFVAVLLIPIIGSDFTPLVTDQGLLRHITFRQALLPSVSRDINPVLWSLTYEVIFYILMPILFACFHGKKTAEWLIILGAIFMIPSFYLMTGPFNPFFQTFNWFVVGIVFAEKSNHLSSIALIVLTSASLLVVLQFNLSVEYQISLYATALFLTLIAFTTFKTEPIKQVISLFLMTILLACVVSYSLYIWHYLPLNVLSYHHQLIVSLLQWGKLEFIWTSDFYRAIATIFTILLFSTISYWLVERPSMGFLRDSLLKATQGRS